MSTLTVGPGQQYTTIAAAVAASSSGDTINVQAGTYTNDFVSISHDLSLNAVGGTVTEVATTQPPNGKAIIDEGGSGVNVSVTGFDISGATVPDANGAAVRYEGGSLTLSTDTIHGNQEGLLGAADPNGSITITGSDFYGNGNGAGNTHNIYVGDIANLTVKGSTISGAAGGHDIKSRAETTTITGNVITDGSGGTASYEVDLPNGGNATVAGNVIEKGANATNPIAISYGEEGGTYANSSLTVQDNTLLNDYTAHITYAVVNDTGVTASITGNSLYGWNNVSSGAASVSGTTTLATEPSLDSLTPSGLTSSGGTGSASAPAPAPAPTPVAAPVTDPIAAGSASGTAPPDPTAAAGVAGTSGSDGTGVTPTTLDQTQSPLFMGGPTPGAFMVSLPADDAGLAAALEAEATQTYSGGSTQASVLQSTAGTWSATFQASAQAGAASVLPDASASTSMQSLVPQAS